MHIGCRNPQLEYTLDGISLEATEEEKDLGIMTDNRLTFRKQASVAILKTCQTLAFLDGPLQTSMN